MKILFLDIQGVMYTKQHPNPGKLENFDVEAIKILNEILESDNKIEIVLSSDWKNWVCLEDMQIFFLKQGIKKAPIGYTSNTIRKYFPYELQRTKEIETWLEQNSDVKTWVIIDDLDMRNYLKNFVWVNEPKIGLKQKNIQEQIIKIFL